MDKCVCMHACTDVYVSACLRHRDTAALLLPSTKPGTMSLEAVSKDAAARLLVDLPICQQGHSHGLQPLLPRQH